LVIGNPIARGASRERGNAYWNLPTRRFEGIHESAQRHGGSSVDLARILDVVQGKVMSYKWLFKLEISSRQRPLFQALWQVQILR
jgi:hypothetical protein